jgi:hypothetical protein
MPLVAPQPLAPGPQIIRIRRTTTNTVPTLLDGELAVQMGPTPPVLWIGTGGGTLNKTFAAGVIDGSNAAAGNVGEYGNVTVAQANAITLTSATNATLCTTTLMPGDWNIEAFAVFTENNTGTGSTRHVAGLSITSGTLFEALGLGPVNSFYHPIPPTGQLNAAFQLVVGPRRLNVNAATPIWLIVQAVFGAGTTVTAYGYMQWRRMR